MLFRTQFRTLTVAMLEQLDIFEAVFDARAPVITREMLPCCKVWTPHETGANLSIGVPELRSVVDLVVQITVEGVDDVANTRLVDELCERTLLWLIEDPGWQTCFERLVSLTTEIEPNTEGEMRTVTATITLGLQYNDLYITRINDLLLTMDIRVIVPDQPTGPNGEPGEEEVRIVIPVESEVIDWPEEATP